MDLRELAAVSVVDTEGQPVRLGDLWRERAAVLVWVRHFGCMFCREQAAEMRGAQPAIERLGGRLAIIGNGGVRAAKSFAEHHAPDVLVLTDPELRSYRAIGARSGVLRTLGPHAWYAGLRAMRRGARQSAVQGHPFQQGAVMVVDPQQGVVLSHISEHAGDHPPLTAVLAALARRSSTPAEAG